MQVQHEQNGNFEKTPVSKVVTFWKVRTAGECQCGLDVSPTETIGNLHEIALQGDELTVVVAYGLAGEKKTTVLSVAALYQEFVKTRSVIEFKYK